MEERPFRALSPIFTLESSGKEWPMLNSIDASSMLSVYSNSIPHSFCVLDLELLIQNMVQMQKCEVVPYEKVVANHFTVCQKPWFCIYQKDKPLCLEFNKKWWKRSRAVEKGLNLEPREECPPNSNYKYIPIDYLSSDVLTA